MKTSNILVWAGLVFAFGLLGYLVFRYPAWFIANGALLLGWILLGVQIVYQRSDRLYWTIQKIKYFVINPDTQWDLSVRYSGLNPGIQTLPLVQKELIKAAKLDRAVVKNKSRSSFEIRADELTIEVVADEENQSLEVFFTKIPVSFRGSQRTIEQRITPVLEAIEKGASISDKIYWLTVYFGNINPYFGLYMRRIKPEQVAEMNIQIGSGDEEQVNISKQKLTIKNTSLVDLQHSARKFLTLSELPA